MIYLIQSREYMKIGYTDNLLNRLSKYSTDNPDYQVLCISNGTMDTEKDWHTKYKCIKGEWGYYDENIVKEFVEKAYLDDIYFETNYSLLAKEDDVGANLLEIYKKGDLEQKNTFIKMFKHKKMTPSLYIVNNELIWKPSENTSLTIFIHNILETLPYKPKRVSLKTEDLKLAVNSEKHSAKGLEWVKQILEDREYTYQELEDLFTPLI